MLSAETVIHFFQSEIEKIRSLTPEERARKVARIYAPGLVLSIVVVYGFIDFGKNIAIAELKTEIAGGSTLSKRGVVIIAEPMSSSVPSDYQIPLTQNSSKIWSSLDEEIAQRNMSKGRLGIDAQGLYGTTPFFGENSPVTLVIEGSLGEEVTIGGDTESVESWRLSSRKGSSLIHSVLINCFLALGIGAATGAPIIDRDKNDASKVGAEPDKD